MIIDRSSIKSFEFECLFSREIDIDSKKWNFILCEKTFYIREAYEKGSFSHAAELRTPKLIYLACVIQSTEYNTGTSIIWKLM